MNKGLEYIKSKIPFSAGFYKGDMEDVIIKGLDIAIKEIIEDLELCKQEFYQCCDSIPSMNKIDRIIKDFKQRHLNTQDTDSKNKEDENGN